MRTLSLLLLLGTCAAGAVYAQGTFVYDQESSTDEVSPFGSVPIQFYGTVGQSFTPGLSAVGFVRLRQFDLNSGNALGATLVVHLRANAMNGPILATTTPVMLNDGFAGAADFRFASAVAVTPATTYFFETVVQSGDNWGITTRSDSRGDVNYPGGVFYGGLTPFTGNDLWFREGILVPEPASASLLLVGGGVAGCILRRAKSRRNGAQESRGWEW